MASIVTPNWEYIRAMIGEVDHTFFEPMEREKTVFDNPATCFLELLDAGAIVDPTTDEPRKLSDLYDEDLGE